MSPYLWLRAAHTPAGGRPRDPRRGARNRLWAPTWLLCVGFTTPKFHQAIEPHTQMLWRRCLFSRCFLVTQCEGKTRLREQRSCHLAVSQKKTVPKWVALVSGNMDQNLRNPSCLILSQNHLGLLFKRECLAPTPYCQTLFLRVYSLRARLSMFQEGTAQMMAKLPVLAPNRKNK